MADFLDDAKKYNDTNAALAAVQARLLQAYAEEAAVNERKMERARAQAQAAPATAQAPAATAPAKNRLPGLALGLVLGIVVGIVALFFVTHLMMKNDVTSAAAWQAFWTKLPGFAQIAEWLSW